MGNFSFDKEKVIWTFFDNAPIMLFICPTFELDE